MHFLVTSFDAEHVRLSADVSISALNIAYGSGSVNQWHKSLRIRIRIKGGEKSVKISYFIEKFNNPNQVLPTSDLSAHDWHQQIFTCSVIGIMIRWVSLVWHRFAGCPKPDCSFQGGSQSFTYFSFLLYRIFYFLDTNGFRLLAKLLF